MSSHCWRQSVHRRKWVLCCAGKIRNPLSLIVVGLRNVQQQRFASGQEWLSTTISSMLSSYSFSVIVSSLVFRYIGTTTPKINWYQQSYSELIPMQHTKVLILADRLCQHRNMMENSVWTVPDASPSHQHPYHMVYSCLVNSTVCCGTSLLRDQCNGVMEITG